MTTKLKLTMGVFYAAVTLLIVDAFAARSAHWVAWGHAATLWLVAVLLPVLWTRALVAKLEEHDVPVERLQVLLVMPMWCAAIAALIALR
jgi:hypothetical protein